MVDGVGECGTFAHERNACWIQKDHGVGWTLMIAMTICTDTAPLNAKKRTFYY